MPAIESYPVGDMALVCSRINGAVAVVDRQARSILEGLSGGEETDELARRHAEAAGGLDQASAQVAALRHLWSRLAAAASTTPPSDLSLPDHDSLALDVVCQFGERPVRLQVWPPRLARMLGAVTAPCHDYSGTDEADARITVVRAGGRYRLAVDGVVCLETRELMVARSEVLRRLVLAAHPGRAWLAVLHAAGVAGPDGAVLLCGSSGAGKSTLTGLLLASGLALVTDDYAPLEVGTRALWPVPFGLSVKDGSWPLLGAAFPRSVADRGDPHQGAPATLSAAAVLRRDTAAGAQPRLSALRARHTA